MFRTLRETLKHEGLTHAEAARALNCTRGSIARWLDMDPLELPGRVALWCAGLLRVEWPEEFRPQLAAVAREEADTDEEVLRRVHVANRLIDRLQKAMLTLQVLQNASGVLVPEEASTTSVRKLSGTEQEPEVAHDNLTAELMRGISSDMLSPLPMQTSSDEKPATTSFSLFATDAALIEQAARALGTNKSSVVRMLVRRFTSQLLKEATE